jgi:hypothetical protein
MNETIIIMMNMRVVPLKEKGFTHFFASTIGSLQRSG